VVLFDADYPYPKVYSDFCYQKSIRAILSGGVLEMGDRVAQKYYSTRRLAFPERILLYFTPLIPLIVFSLHQVLYKYYQSSFWHRGSHLGSWPQ